MQGQPVVHDGMRGSRGGPDQKALSRYPEHMPEAKGKIVFVATRPNGPCRGLRMELQREKTMLVDGQLVVSQPQIDAIFQDGILICDPADPIDAKRIELIQKTEFFEAGGKRSGGVVRIRDRKDVIEEQETKRLEAAIEEHAKIMSDPRLVARLQQITGKTGFGETEGPQAEA